MISHCYNYTVVRSVMACSEMVESVYSSDVKETFSFLCFCCHCSSQCSYGSQLEVLVLWALLPLDASLYLRTCFHLAGISCRFLKLTRCVSNGYFLTFIVFEGFVAPLVFCQTHVDVIYLQWEGVSEYLATFLLYMKPSLIYYCCHYWF